MNKEKKIQELNADIRRLGEKLRDDLRKKEDGQEEIDTQEANDQLNAKMREVESLKE